MIVAPETAFDVTFDYGETGLVGQIGVSILDGSYAVVTARSESGIVEGNDGAYVATLTSPSTAGDYIIRADIDAAEPYIDEALTVGDAETLGVFAAVEDVETRIGRELTAAEEAQTLAVISMVTDLIAEALYQDSDWADALTPIPATLKNICVEKSIVALANPKGLESETETLGAFSHTERFRADQSAATAGIFLTAADRAKARRAVYGSNVTSVRVPSVLEEYLEDALGS